MRAWFRKTGSLLIFCSSLLFSQQATATTYSNAESGNDGWTLYDQTPAGARITVVTDSVLQSRVIQTQGDGRNNSYILGGFDAASGWNNRDEFLFEWKMATDEPFVVSVNVDTTAGMRRMFYNKSNADSLKNPANNTIAFGLGSAIVDGNWYTHRRDLADDVATGEPGNRLLGVNGVVVLGSVRLDDLVLVTGGDDPDEPPTAVIQSNTSSGVAPLSVNFSASGSSAVAPATLTDYSWNFGNGSISNLESATTVFSEPGTYQVRLTVTDSNALTANTTRVVTVRERNDPSEPPTATIQSSTDSGPAPLTVNFNAAASTAVPPATLTGYVWNLVATGSV